MNQATGRTDRRGRNSIAASPGTRSTNFNAFFTPNARGFDANLRRFGIEIESMA
jgi:hypothetical protein